MLSGSGSNQLSNNIIDYKLPRNENDQEPDVNFGLFFLVFFTVIFTIMLIIEAILQYFSYKKKNRIGHRESIESNISENSV